MATKIGDLFFEVNANSTKADQAIAKFAKNAEGALGTIGKTVAATIGAGIGVAVVGMAALTYETLQAGVAYNTLGQSATAAFSTIYTDTEAAYDILQQISQLDLETPFSGQSLTRTARTLAGFGVAKDDVVDVTFALSEATAAMGLGSEALERMAIAFGQIQSRGKLAGDEARQLANYGIDVYGLLAQEMGKSVAQVRELGRQSLLTADVVLPTLLSAIENRFGGASEALFNTFAGQAEGLRSIMEGVGSALIEPLIGFSTGGALVDAMGAIRDSLIDVVSVAEDGSFRLQGFLEPLSGVMDKLAESVVEVGDAIAGWLDGLDENSIPDFVASIEGLEPLLAGLAVAFGAAFVSVIPFIGGFVTATSAAAAAIAAVVATSGTIRGAVVDAFNEMYTAAEPLLPLLVEFGVAAVDALEDALPAAIDAIVEGFKALVPLLEVLIPIGTKLLDALGPALAGALTAVADVLESVGEAIEFLGPEVVILAGGLIALPAILTTIASLATSAAIATLYFGDAVTALSGRLTVLIPQLAIAYASLLGIQGIKAGATGDDSFLTNDDGGLFGTKDLFRDAVKFGLQNFAGEGAAVRDIEALADLNAQLAIGKELGEAYAQAQKDSGLSVDAFGKSLADVLPSQEAVAYAMWEYKRILEEIQAAHVAAAREIDANEAFEMWENRVNGIIPELNALNEEIETEIDLLAQLEKEAQAAWDALDEFTQLSPESGIDEFLRSLPDLAKELSDAMKMDDGIFRDLNIRGATDQITTGLATTITETAKALGIGLKEIEALFNKQGLQGVLAALGIEAEQTAEKIDPIVQQYQMLDASAEQLHDAIRNLEDQRTTRIRAEIDQLEAALRDAEGAAERARQSLIDLFTGGYDSGPQSLIDDLIGNLDGIGSQIEEALKTGGALGEASLRSALGGFNSQIAAIFQAGMEAGLNPQQIIDMLGPVGAALQQVVGSGLDRIVTLDWTSGITPAAAGELSAALQAVLGNAGGIGAAFDDIFNADSAVANLQAQIEAKKAQLDLEVTFSPEQVQSELDRMTPPMVETELLVSPEAQAELERLIQEGFDNDEFKLKIDRANFKQQVLDTALEIENSLTLTLTTDLEFNRDQLMVAASALGPDFANAFNLALQSIAGTLVEGFQSQVAAEAALGPAVAGATAGSQNVVNIGNDITINSNQPIPTASEVVSAQSAAAGAGGRISVGAAAILSRYGNGTSRIS